MDALLTVGERLLGRSLPRIIIQQQERGAYGIVGVLHHNDPHS